MKVYEEKLANLGMRIPNILLPSPDIDYSKYSVIACDQFSAQPEYWEKAKEYIGDAPSTLHMILPEAYLINGDKDYDSRCEVMNRYLSDGTLRDIGKSFIYTLRETPDGIRRGLVAAFDLEEYDFGPNPDKLIKVTEKTDITRVLPRVEIRKKAPLELPHILMLLVDKKDVFFPYLDRQKENYEKVYDFELMLGGGNIKGYKITKEEDLEQIADLLTENFIENGSTFSFAIGDGNHSFASAKCYWDELKKNLSEEEKENHPARFVLAELMNLYDESMPYETINRLLTNIKDKEKALKELDVDLKNLPPLPILQEKLDAWLIRHPDVRLDYIHDAETCKKLGEKEDAIAFTYHGFDRDQVYDVIKANKIFGRKSFAMGHPIEKRFYLEARKIKE